LRSYEIDQNEIAYYFSALALGLLAGLSPELNLVVVGLMIIIVGSMFVADHPRLYKGYKQELVVLDKAYPIENEMIAALSEMLNADVKKATIKRLDFVNDSTLVDVRYKNR
jgi:hypothetical protein